MEEEGKNYESLKKVLNFVQGTIGWIMIAVWLTGSILTFAVLCTINIIISFIIAVALKEDSGKGWWREAVEGGTQLMVAMLGTTLISNQSPKGINSLCPDWYLAVAILVIWANHGHLIGWVLRHVSLALMFLARFTDWGAGRTIRVQPMMAMAGFSGTGEVVLNAFDEASSAASPEGEAAGAD